MKTNPSDDLKADLPPTPWGKVLSATPVVMTVIATMLAGLSSSEMTRAQYDRSTAAQLQAKAGDQWSFFQAKRLRSAVQRNALEIAGLTADLPVLSSQALRDGVPALNADWSTPAGQATLAALDRDELPALPPPPPLDSNIDAALKGMEGPEAAMHALLSPVADAVLEAALRASQERTRAFDATTAPISQLFDRIERALSGSSADRTLGRAFSVARLRFNAKRYDAESSLNQVIANLYELQVRKSNFSADRHSERSQRFFYGMLAAQLAVIMATFAIAARQRSLLWAVAAGAGVVAVLFAGYVYLYI